MTPEDTRQAILTRRAILAAVEKSPLPIITQSALILAIGNDACELSRLAQSLREISRAIDDHADALPTRTEDTWCTKCHALWSVVAPYGMHRDCYSDVCPDCWEPSEWSRKHVPGTKCSRWLDDPSYRTTGPRSGERP